MNKVPVFDLAGNKTDEFSVSQKLIAAKQCDQAIFDSVIAERASRRQGTHSTLKKGEVSGGGKKPYQQKHTGRARQGSIRNPHYVGGGVAFGPKPGRNYLLKVNKKVSALAFRSALTQMLNANAVKCLTDAIDVSTHSTKAFARAVDAIAGAKGAKVLVVLSKPNAVLAKSAANLRNVTLKKWDQVSVQDLLDARTLIAQPGALDSWAERMR